MEPAVKMGLGPALLAPVLQGKKKLLPYRVDLTRGSMGRLAGATWSAAGGAAKNEPAQGPELVEYGAMESAPAGWGPENATLGASSDAHGGEKALQVTSGAGGFGNGNRDVTTKNNAWYSVGVCLKAQQGTARAILYKGSTGNYYWRTPNVTESEYLEFLGALRSETTSTRFKLFAWNANDAALFDDVRMHELETGSLLAVLPATESDVVAGGDWRIADGFQAGVVVNLDNRSDPKNFVLGYYDRAVNKAKLVKCVNGEYTELIAQDVAYVEGAVIKVEKEDTTYKLYYDHQQVGTDQSIEDTSIIGNKLHGVFSTGGGSELETFFCERVSEAGAKEAVFFGGSITAGSVVTDVNLKYATQAGKKLQDNYPADNWTITNKGLGGTASWWGLHRLQEDVIDRAPDLVVLDFAVNDYDHPHHRRQAEAMIRRLRTLLPGARLAAMIFLEVADKNGSDATNLKAPVAAAWKALCARYGIPIVDYAKEVQHQIAGGETTLSALFADNVHPNNAGHTLAAERLGELLSGNFFKLRQLAGELPDRIYDNGEYEAEPLQLDPAEGETSGTWTPAEGGLSSSEAGATITFEAECQSFGLDCNYGAGAAVVEYQVDGGSWSEYNYEAAGVNWHCLWTGNRGAHVIVMRVKSGTLLLRKFLAI